MAWEFLNFIPVIGGGLYGAIEQVPKANKALEELAKQPYPNYLTGQEIHGQADKLATGYTPAEKANFFGTLARLNNQRYRVASDRNPTLSGVVQAGINYGNTGALTQFAANDAQLRRQNLSRLESLIGRQANMQTSSRIQKRQMEEQAYGMAKQAGVQNIKSTGDAIANIGIALLTGGMGGGIGGGRQAGTSTQTTQLTGMGNNFPQPYYEPIDYTAPSSSYYGYDYLNPFG